MCEFLKVIDIFKSGKKKKNRAAGHYMVIIDL